MIFVLFFFFKQKTAYEMRISDWSSDVCSSDLPMMTSILTSNDSHIDRAFEMVQRRGRRKVALFGLAFKPGTDDLRESPFVSLAERLIGKGFDVAIFDRSVDLARLDRKSTRLNSRH